MLIDRDLRQARCLPVLWLIRCIGGGALEELLELCYGRIVSPLGLIFLIIVQGRQNLSTEFAAHPHRGSLSGSGGSFWDLGVASSSQVESHGFGSTPGDTGGHHAFD